ncbi:ribosome recycling factor [Sodalis-like secondary symbiont of Drepanosiphum platanoidis]|uniref:ribosome recycling factor n=1 Tax=Sodalis-like secondary symbiont of Drepanosiphum platanoidis TaxID=2994493 RepID=UPI003463C5FA
MIKKFYQDTELKMKKCINTFISSINNFRIGKISTNILDGIKIPYDKNCYVLLKKISNITLKNSNTLSITVFDKKFVSIIKKTILISNLGVNPFSNGSIIYLSFPQISEERRKELLKIIKSYVENSKVSIRNIRRESNNIIKKNLKKKIINKDQEYNMQNQINKLTDYSIKNLDKIFLEKEKDIFK